MLKYLVLFEKKFNSVNVSFLCIFVLEFNKRTLCIFRFRLISLASILVLAHSNVRTSMSALSLLDDVDEADMRK